MRYIAAFLMILCSACVNPSNPIKVSPDKAQLIVEDSISFTAADNMGKPLDPSSVVWVSSNPAVASINQLGIATGVSVGDTSITAKVGGLNSDPVPLKITQPQKGQVRVYAPTPEKPGRTINLPVEIKKDYALYQGDILFPLTDLQATSVKSQGNTMVSYNSIFSSRQTWPGRTIEYEFDSGIDPSIKNLVQQAALIYKQRTDINIVPHTSNPYYIVVKQLEADDNRCGSSQVGFRAIQGPFHQSIYFKAGCGVDTYLHEFGHALGLWHEQARADRDQYITVLYNNIISSAQDQYDITDSSDGQPQGPYDYGSIMHYPVKSSASKKDNNGKSLPTFVLKNSSAYDINLIGYQNDLSVGDILALNALYNLPVLDVKLTIGALGVSSLLTGAGSSFSVGITNQGPQSLNNYYLVLTAQAPTKISYTGNKYNCQSVFTTYLACWVSGANLSAGQHVALKDFRVEIPESFSSSGVEVAASLSLYNQIALKPDSTQDRRVFSVTQLFPDKFETNDSFANATLISSGFDSNQINLHVSSDQDFFTFSAPDASAANKIAYTLETEAPLDTSTPLQVDLFNSSQQFVRSGVVAGDGGTGVIIGDPGTYFVRIKGNKTRYFAKLDKINLDIPPSLVGLVDTLRFLGKGTPIERTLVKASDFFSVKASDPAAPPSVVKLGGSNLKLSLLDQSGHKIAEGSPSTPDAQSLSLPAGAGQDLVLQIQRSQDTLAGDLPIELPALPYSLELK